MFIIKDNNLYPNYLSIRIAADNLIKELDWLDMYSTEELSMLSRFFLTAKNLLYGVVLLNKTNITNLMHGMKRSELRAYFDRYRVSINLIENSSTGNFKDVSLPAPTGIKGKMSQLADFVQFAYEQLGDKSIDKELMNTAKSIYSDWMTVAGDKELISNMSLSKSTPRYTQLNNKLKPLIEQHLKLITPDEHKKRVSTENKLFKQLYDSIDNMKYTRTVLLNQEKKLLTVASRVKLADKISDLFNSVIGAIEKDNYSPPKDYVVSLLHIISTMALYYDVTSVALKTQLITEHNMILQYHQLEENIV